MRLLVHLLMAVSIGLTSAVGLAASMNGNEPDGFDDLAQTKTETVANANLVLESDASAENEDSASGTDSEIVVESSGELDVVVSHMSSAPESEDMHKFTLTSTSDMEAAAQGKLKAAKNKLESTQNFLDSKKAGLTVEERAKAQTKLNAAAELIAQGEVSLNAGDFDKAFKQFKQAIKAIQKAKTEILNMLRNDDDDDDDDDRDDREKDDHDHGNRDGDDRGDHDRNHRNDRDRDSDETSLIANLSSGADVDVSIENNVETDGDVTINNVVEVIVNNLSQ